MDLLFPESQEFGRTLDELLFTASPDPNYSTLGIEYYREYCNTLSFKDLSFIIMERGVPVLAFVASSHEITVGTIEVAAFGQPSFYVEALPHRASGKAVRKILKKIIQQYIDNIKNGNFRYLDYLQGNNLSQMSRYLLGQGASVTPLFGQIIDLTQHVSQLRKEVRKSYKSLINWGLNNLGIRIFDASNASSSALWDFRRLHIAVAGRETRSEESWNVQFRMIQNGNAFLVLGTMKDSLETGAFFSLNKQSCYYGVSASNRDLFAKPISHAVIWTAMLYAKEQGCTNFIMGQQHYPGDVNHKPSQKELGISTFKRGFGGETKVSMEIQLTKAQIELS